MCVWACSRVCVGAAEVGENPLLLRVMEYTRGYWKHASDKTTWLISKWKQCINSVLNKLDKDNVEGLALV